MLKEMHEHELKMIENDSKCLQQSMRGKLRHSLSTRQGSSHRKAARLQREDDSVSVVQQFSGALEQCFHGKSVIDLLR